MTIERRSLLFAGAVAAAEFGSGSGAWADAPDPIRYPDARLKVLDPRFQSLILGNAAIERIADRLPLHRGTGVVWRSALSRVERHPERPA